MPLSNKVSNAVLNQFRKFLPPLSETEREALYAGTVGWDKEILGGSPDWKQLFKLQKPELTKEEQAFLDGPTEKLCKMLNNWEINKQNDLPKEVWDFMKKEGFFGLEIPTEYGGMGFSSQAHSAIVMKIASRSIVGAVTVMVPNSLGPAELIHEYGTKEQKDYYLPRLAKGDEIPCFALTGPEAGSDATSLPDRGVVCKNEQGEIGIRLNWEKRYITLGPVATLVGLAFQLEDPEGLLGDKNKKDYGITVALVPRDTKGVTIGARHQPMDLGFMNGPNSGKDVFLPLDAIIGGPAQAGKGWTMLMECLAVGRSLSLPALSVAASKFAGYATGAYSRVRRQFGMAIGKFEGIEEVMGPMAGQTYMMNAARAATLQMVDEGQRPTIPSAMLKYHLTENMRKIVSDAMDVHGGKAISNGPDNLFVESYKGIPIAITVEGANIMTRNLIIFGQGSVRSHPYLPSLLTALYDKDSNRGLKQLTGTGIKYAAHIVKNTVKSLTYGLTNGFGSSMPKGVDKKTKKYYRQINRMSAALGLATDATVLSLGGGLKKKERVSARLGDVYSNLYMASATLWYYEKMGQKKEDLALVEWACTKSLRNAEKAMIGALKEHPNKFIGFMLQPLVFPKGKLAARTTDAMDRKAADYLREPGEARDRLTAGIYIPTDPTEPLAKLTLAFQKSIETEPLEKKLSQAARKKTFETGSTREDFLANAVKASVITADEFKLIKEADAIRREVIMVDSFAPDAFRQPANTNSAKPVPRTMP